MCINRNMYLIREIILFTITIYTKATAVQMNKPNWVLPGPPLGMTCTVHIRTLPFSQESFFNEAEDLLLSNQVAGGKYVIWTIATFHNNNNTIQPTISFFEQ